MFESREPTGTSDSGGGSEKKNPAEFIRLMRAFIDLGKEEGRQESAPGGGTGMCLSQGFEGKKKGTEGLKGGNRKGFRKGGGLSVEKERKKIGN